MPRIANIDFSQEFFDDYIKNIFGESFAHSSLSFEKAFEESKIATTKLKEFILPQNTRYARMLEASPNPEDQALLKQRLGEVRACLIYYGVPENSFENEFGITVPGVDGYEKYFYGCVRPYRNTKELHNAENNGILTGEDYEQETLLVKVQELKQLIECKIQADLNAEIYKQANNEAFEYALSKDQIGIKDIQEINAIVNNARGIQTGYRKINNQINDCPFETCSKEYVPVRMLELVHRYNNDWAESIPKLNPETATEQDIEEYLTAFCEREAKFHIEFERIHPFEDGNGRTGRIILNQHLIKNESAPILITPEMRKMYINCIDKRDYKTLGQLIYMLSSVTINDMMSLYRQKNGLKPGELSYAEVGGKTFK